MLGTKGTESGQNVLCRRVTGPYILEQDFLLPPSLQELLPEGHLSYFVSDMVDQLDLSAIHAVYEEESRGQPPAATSA